MIPEMKEFVLEKWAKLLEKEQWSQAENVEAFEEAFAKFVGRKHAVAVSNGTDALWMAAQVLGVRKFGVERAIVPNLTVPMVGWAMERAGAELLRHDVSENFIIEDLREGLRWATEKSTVLVMVWTAGIMTEKAVRLVDFCRWHGIPVLEDASHAHGAALQIDGKIYKAGSIGDVSVFSMYATKVLTSGEGGVIVTDDEEKAKQLKVFANGGKQRGSLKVEVNGWNCRMTEIQAVLGLANIRWEGKIIAERAAIAHVYRKAGLKCVQDEIKGLIPSWYKFTVRTPEGKADEVTARLKELGGRVTARTHGPEDLVGDRPAEVSPVARNLMFSHVNPPTSWVDPVKAEAIALALKKVLE